MIFYNAFKLMLTTITQVFKILFYCLVAFLLVFGCMFTFAHSYFSILVHSRFFDNLVEIIKGLFVSLNVSQIYNGAIGIGKSLGEYFDILKVKGFAIEIILGLGLIILLFLLIFWLRFGISRTLHQYATQHVKKSPFKEMIKNPKENFRQVFASIIFTGIYDIVLVVLVLSLTRFVNSLSISNAGQYSILLIFTLLLFAVRAMLFNGWEYIQHAKNTTATKALLTNIRNSSQNFFTMFFNSILLILFSWLIFILCGRILVGYFIIIAFAITYLLTKCYGVSTYYYYTKEPFYIMGRKCSFKVKPSLIDKTINKSM